MTFAMTRNEISNGTHKFGCRSMYFLWSCIVIGIRVHITCSCWLKPSPPLPFWGVQGRCGSIGASWIALPQVLSALAQLHCVLLINQVFPCILLIICFPGKPDLRYTTIFPAHCNLLINSGLHCILLINHFRPALRCNVPCYSIRAVLFSELPRAKLRC